MVSNAFSSIVKNKVDRIKKDSGSNSRSQKKGVLRYAMEKSSEAYNQKRVIVA